MGAVRNAFAGPVRAAIGLECAQRLEAKATRVSGPRMDGDSDYQETAAHVQPERAAGRPRVAITCATNC